MAITFMADNGTTITAAQDGAMYNLFANNKNIVVSGIGNNLAVSYNASSLQVTLGTGEGIICGRHFNVTGTDTKLNLSASTTAYLVVRYDLSQSGSNMVKFMSVASTRHDNINGSGTISDLVLGRYTTSASGVSSFTDMREIYSASPIENVEYATSAGTAGSATRLGSANVGGVNQPIYLVGGLPYAITGNAGGTKQLMYLENGIFKTSTVGVGNGINNMYLNNGQFTLSTDTVGGSKNPMYMSNGVFVASHETVGSASQVTYLSNGTITAGMTIRTGTGDPSGGNDGDIYIQYTA